MSSYEHGRQFKYVCIVHFAILVLRPGTKNSTEVLKNTHRITGMYPISGTDAKSGC